MLRGTSFSSGDFDAGFVTGEGLALAGSIRETRTLRTPRQRP
jgi:hypothetical protein